MSAGSQVQVVKQVSQITREVSPSVLRTHLLSLLPTLIGCLAARQHGANPPSELNSPVTPLRSL